MWVKHNFNHVFRLVNSTPMLFPVLVQKLMVCFDPSCHKKSYSLRMCCCILPIMGDTVLLCQVVS